MTDGADSIVVIPLRDGRQLSVSSDGMRIGDRLYALDLMQEARILRRTPELAGVTMRDVGLVEFDPARSGDGSVILDALYRLRPALRPLNEAPLSADVQTTDQDIPHPNMPMMAPPLGPYAPPPTMPTFGSYGPPPGYFSVPYPGYPGFGPPPGAPLPPPGFPPFMGYAPNPNAGRGELTPAPRSFGQVLEAIFRLYGKQFRGLLLLSLAAVAIPYVLLGCIEVAFLVAEGQNPLVGSFGATSTPGFPASPTAQATPSFNMSDFVQTLAIAGVSLVMSLLISAWVSAVMSQGARSAVRGQAISVGAALRDGLRRFFPTLSVVVRLFLIVFAMLLPSLALFGGGMALAFSVMVNGAVPSSSSANGSLALGGLLLLISLVLILATVPLVLWISIRLALAPYAAALGMSHPLRVSWNVTRNNWWRTFGVFIIINLIVSVAVGLGSDVQLASYLVAVVGVTPLLEVFAVPLVALTGVILLFDLRLRREGYAFFQQEMTPSEQAPTPSAPQQNPAPTPH